MNYTLFFACLFLIVITSSHENHECSKYLAFSKDTTQHLRKEDGPVLLGFYAGEVKQSFCVNYELHYF